MVLWGKGIGVVTLRRKRGEEKRRQKAGRKVRGEGEKGGAETQRLQIPNLGLFKVLLLLRKHSTLDDFP